ncbi:MAG: hypothetical protein MIO90_01390 [Methanomassiliicoccales archaeon]|nr:hypothetical protein [Methanomassiliicoccales archaeon]
MGADPKLGSIAGNAVSRSETNGAHWSSSRILHSSLAIYVIIFSPMIFGMGGESSPMIYFWMLLMIIIDACLVLVYVLGALEIVPYHDAPSE